MDRRDFIKTATVAGGACTILGPSAFAGIAEPSGITWGGAMRWVQLAFVENDPVKCDPDFWLSYFKRIHADGVLLSAGGVVAFYPTEIPLHHRSDYLGNKDLLGYMMEGCRKMNMKVCVRTDPHAARQNVYDAHPDWIAVTADGQKRRHWANPELWVTCGLGPYNFEFMTSVHKEIMTKYHPEGIFSNRWNGSGMCYCEHCIQNFKDFSGGMELPRGNQNRAATAKYREWNVARLKDLWFLWDGEIRKIKPGARFIPNGFPDPKITAKLSDIFFADRQGRSGDTPPWSSGRGAKELRSGGMGMKPIIHIFSVGMEEAPRWKDSVNTEAELRIWAAGGVANGMHPCFVKFNATPIDKRWIDPMAKIYQGFYKSERYLKNTAHMARVAIVVGSRGASEQPWQQDAAFHLNGMYHNLVEGHMPFEMVHVDLLDAEHLKPFKLLILPNVSTLSDTQCSQIRAFVKSGGSLLASFESSLYDETGKKRTDFGLADLFGVSLDGGVEGPMKNSYLTLRTDPATHHYHPVLEGLEDATRIINGIYRVKVKPTATDFPSPVTLVPTYPDLPMEDVYTRVADTNERELYLRQMGKSRVAYIPWDIERSFWQYMSPDHSRLLSNTIRWVLNEEPVVKVKSPGLVETTAWRQEHSMTIHLVNMTNPMMLKGPFRDIIPVAAMVDVRVPANARVTGVKLLMAGTQPAHTIKNGFVSLHVPQILDHEIVALDLA